MIDHIEWRCIYGSFGKRKDYISWDAVFYGHSDAFRHALEGSEYPGGACIVDPEHKILSMGYNGFPLGCSDDEFTWAREGEDNKYFYEHTASSMPS